jgi:hypothetical protein
VHDVPPILLKEEPTSRIGARYKPIQSKSTDSRETYGVKAVDWESDAQVRMRYARDRKVDMAQNDIS